MRMKLDKLSWTDMANFTFKHRLAGHHGNGVNKSLDAVIRHKEVRYKVMSHRELIIDTPCLNEAVDAFNEAEQP